MTLTDPNTVIALSRFRAELTRSLARRGKRIAEASDLPSQVDALSPIESYFVVKELGADSAVPLLQHFSEEQFRTLIDIDGWSGDEPQPEDIDAWLAVYRSASPEALAAAFLRLDDELQTLMLSSMLTVWDPNLDTIPEPSPKARRKSSPDQHFVVEARDEIEWEVDPFELLEALYRSDINEGFRQLVTARSDLTSNLTEQALRFRNGRLEDWGFPPRERAIRIFSPPDPALDAITRPAPSLFSHLPAIYASPLTEGSLLVRAASRIEDEAFLRSFQEELVFLINSAAVAYSAALRDVDHVISIAERVRDTASLGLDLHLQQQGLESGDEDQRVDAAAQVLLKTRVENLFRRGHQRFAELGKTASALAEDPVVAIWLNAGDPAGNESLVERTERSFLRALCTSPPGYAGFDPARPDRIRGVASLEELAQLERRLDRLSERF